LKEENKSSKEEEGDTDRDCGSWYGSEERKER